MHRHHRHRHRSSQRRIDRLFGILSIFAAVLLTALVLFFLF
jgi:hypothetical protein